MTKIADVSLFEFISLLPELHNQHARDTKVYASLDKVLKLLVSKSNLQDDQAGSILVDQDKQLIFPYFSMGAVSTLNLFELDEMIIFSFYAKNRRVYKKTADIGANLGLHSILMALCGFDVQAYEPDPVHHQLLNRNLKLNQQNVKTYQAAVSDHDGEAQFIRVLGNTTGSHLAGAKDNPYGNLEKFSVKVESIVDILENVDFVKMDVEGQELKIISATEKKHWLNVDMMLEIGTLENAQGVFEHLTKIGVNSFSQKTGWQKVSSLKDMPVSYKEGSLFISIKEKMPW